ncbi:hypothetical protein WME98_37985 [Sorangium sp. So ce296]|uniref:hypothetical protein n=1 Tax=Sorangium sp. So ce296 TaxID=3133296 RepID=UPI003F6301DE
MRYSTMLSLVAVACSIGAVGYVEHRLRTVDRATLAAAGPGGPSAGEDPAARARAMDAFYQELSDRVEREPPDPRWRAEAEEELGAKLREALPREVQVTALACASTLCRLELSHPQMDTLSSALVEKLIARAVVGDMGTNFQRFPGRTRVYLSRPPG